mgnify:FL=1
MTESSLKGILKTAQHLGTLIYCKDYEPMNETSLGLFSDELGLLIEDLIKRTESGEN